jgi:hypothetical protein
MNDTTPKSDRILTTNLRWDDRAQMRQWLTVLRDATHDSLAAGDDATRPLRERVLSRAEAKRKLCEAETSIAKLLTLAEDALDAA